MKRVMLLITLVMLTLRCHAELDPAYYLCFMLFDTASTADVTTVKADLKTFFNDQTEVNWTQLWAWHEAADTNNTGRILPVHERSLIRANANPTNLTLSALNTWKAADLVNSNCLFIGRGTDWNNVYTNAGYEPVPTE